MAEFAAINAALQSLAEAVRMPQDQNGNYERLRGVVQSIVRGMPSHPGYQDAFITIEGSIAAGSALMGGDADFTMWSDSQLGRVTREDRCLIAAAMATQLPTLGFTSPQIRIGRKAVTSQVRLQQDRGEAQLGLSPEIATLCKIGLGRLPASVLPAGISALPIKDTSEESDDEVGDESDEERGVTPEGCQCLSGDGVLSFDLVFERANFASRVAPHMPGPLPKVVTQTVMLLKLVKTTGITGFSAIKNQDSLHKTNHNYICLQGQTTRLAGFQSWLLDALVLCLWVALEPKLVQDSTPSYHLLLLLLAALRAFQISTGPADSVETRLAFLESLVADVMRQGKVPSFNFSQLMGKGQFISAENESRRLSRALAQLLVRVHVNPDTPQDELVRDLCTMLAPNQPVCSAALQLLQEAAPAAAAADLVAEPAQLIQWLVSLARAEGLPADFRVAVGSQPPASGPPSEAPIRSQLPAARQASSQQPAAASSSRSAGAAANKLLNTHNVFVMSPLLPTPAVSLAKAVLRHAAPHIRIAEIKQSNHAVLEIKAEQADVSKLSALCYRYHFTRQLEEAGWQLKQHMPPIQHMIRQFLRNKFRAQLELHGRSYLEYSKDNRSVRVRGEEEWWSLTDEEYSLLSTTST